MQRLIREVRRRNVHRAAAGYLAMSWIVLQLAEVMMEIYDLDQGAAQWIVAVLAVGFVPAMALAWIFEFTPSGLKRESEIRHTAAEERASGGRLDRILIALLALGLVVLAVDRFLLEPAEETADGAVGSQDAAPATAAQRPSIAVLPFLDLSPAGDQDHFASGIAEELLNLLTRLPGLDVAARTSSFSFKGKDVPISDIAARLNVRYVLEGSVRTSGERLRITAQLIDATTGYHVWSENYDSASGDLFEIQEDVASRVVRIIEPTLLARLPPVQRADPEAHALVLEAEYLAGQVTPETLSQAVQRFQAALDLDPSYARAWLGLSVTYNNLAATGMVDWDTGHQQALAAAKRSLELDTDLPGAYDQLAWIARAYQGDVPAAAHYLEKALALAPRNPDVVGHAAVLLQSIGRLPQALPLHEFSVERDPLDPIGLFNLGLAYYFADRLEAAAAQLRRVLQLSPDYRGAHYRLGTIALRQGQRETALAEFEREPDPEFRIKGRALALFALGRRDEADAALEALIDGWGDQWPSEVAQVYAYRGDVDAAFEWLEKDFAVAGAAGWGEWRLMHLYQNLHHDPRWDAFLERVGASDEQLAAIEFAAPAVDQLLGLAQ